MGKMIDTNDFITKSCTFLVGFCAVVSGLAGLYLLNGAVFSQLWEWFIVTQFGLPPLSLTSAIGVGMVISFATHQYVPTEDVEWTSIIGTGIIHPLLVLAFGWILTFFI